MIHRSIFFLCLLVCFSAHSQSLSPARQQADSLQRALMSDSLGLSTSVINQVFVLRDSSRAQALRIQGDSTLNTQQQGIQLQALRRQTIEATRQLMGASSYEQYLLLLSHQ